jgi:hypothetical protein
MITGIQPKILLETDDNGNLKMDGELNKLLFGDGKQKWKLVRENDGKTQIGSEIKWIEWKENGWYKSSHDEPAIGRSLILDPKNVGYTWLTTTITEILDYGWEDYIKFRTENSIYELFKL